MKLGFQEATAVKTVTLCVRNQRCFLEGNAGCKCLFTQKILIAIPPLWSCSKQNVVDKDLAYWSLTNWIHIPSCVTMSKFFRLSVLSFSQLEGGDVVEQA